MSRDSTIRPLIVIVGPTAAGKSDFALELAKKINGEIISADSRQIYKQLNLGTGKPTQSMLETIPHHLVSYSPLGKTITAAKFSELASDYYKQIEDQGKYCLLVGGTGLWIKAFVDGLAVLPAQDIAFRKKMKIISQLKGKQVLYDKLVKIDKQTADKIGRNDETRIIRALEIYHLTGQRASYLRQSTVSSQTQSAIWFGIDCPREELYQRSEARIDQWIKQGWIDEVKQLLSNSAIPLDTPALKAIGLPTINEFLLKNIALERCVDLIKRDTRRYIKRQLTWFKKNKRIIWISQNEVDLAINHIQLVTQTMPNRY